MDDTNDTAAPAPDVTGKAATTPGTVDPELVRATADEAINAHIADQSRPGRRGGWPKGKPRKPIPLGQMGNGPDTSPLGAPPEAFDNPFGAPAGGQSFDEDTQAALVDGLIAVLQDIRMAAIGAIALHELGDVKEAQHYAEQSRISDEAKKLLKTGGMGFVREMNVDGKAAWRMALTSGFLIIGGSSLKTVSTLRQKGAQLRADQPTPTETTQ